MPSQDYWDAIAADIGLEPSDSSVFAAIIPCYDDVRARFYDDFDSYLVRCSEISAQTGICHELVQLYYMVALGGDYLHDTASTVPTDIRRATLGDITLWVDSYRKQTGRLGLGEYRWIRHHLIGKLFRLGRLQFELPKGTWRDNWPTLAGDAAVPDKDDIVLHVHIPHGDRLDYAACQVSYYQAMEFFQQHLGLLPVAFACDTWLLHPCLGQILPPESNILKFQSDYTICHHDYDDNQTLERVFGLSWERGQPFPQSTSLQRAVATYIAGGGRVGNGYGIRYA